MAHAARERGRSWFPIQLYASLLAALLALMRPQGVVERVESTVRAVAVLPFRAYGSMLGEPAHAADGSVASELLQDEALSRARVRTFWARLVEVERHRLATMATEDRFFESHTPRLTRVRGRSRRGARLILDRRWSSMDGYADVVTVGDVLVGFLVPRPVTPDGQNGFVEVVLLGGQSGRGRGGGRRFSEADPVPRAVAARVETDGGPLRFVVEPAASIDPWPLRCALMDDPYLAARVRRDGYEVRTTALATSSGLLSTSGARSARFGGNVPAGLKLGTFRVWGYRRGEERLPIGFFVERPASQGLPLVTLWRRQDAHGTPKSVRESEHAAATGWRRLALRVFSLVRGDGRLHATLPFSTTPPPVGAPIVRGDRLVGTVRAAGPGFAVINAFGGIGSRWDTVLVPARGEPRRLQVRVVAADEHHVWVDAEDSTEGNLSDLGAFLRASRGGGLFTSSLDGPPGLWLGDAYVDTTYRADDEAPASAPALRIPRPKPVGLGGLSVLIPPAPAKASPRQERNR